MIVYLLFSGYFQLSEAAFWLSGGIVDDINYTSSTEYYAASTQTFEAGPELPHAIRSHCFARWDRHKRDRGRDMIYPHKIVRRVNLRTGTYDSNFVGM